jgi:hypothetical protein
MSRPLVHVCLNHPVREAVARCPECRGYFCRECITEHDERVICAACLRKLVQPKTTRRRSFAPLLRVVAAGASLLIAWMVFYWVGQALLLIPSNFHEGTLWKESLLQPDP